MEELNSEKSLVSRGPAIVAPTRGQWSWSSCYHCGCYKMSVVSPAAAIMAAKRGQCSVLLLPLWLLQEVSGQSICCHCGCYKMSMVSPPAVIVVATIFQWPGTYYFLCGCKKGSEVSPAAAIVAATRSHRSVQLMPL